MGGHSYYEGDIELMGGSSHSPPPPPPHTHTHTRENPEASALSQPLTVDKVLVYIADLNLLQVSLKEENELIDERSIDSEHTENIKLQKFIKNADFIESS